MPKKLKCGCYQDAPPCDPNEVVFRSDECKFPKAIRHLEAIIDESSWPNDGALAEAVKFLEELWDTEFSRGL
jgi:hypothetical protein